MRPFEAYPVILDYLKASKTGKLLDVSCGTGNLLLAVFVFGEPFTRTHLITFLFIWTALAIVMIESLARGTARGVPRVP